MVLFSRQRVSPVSFLNDKLSEISFRARENVFEWGLGTRRGGARWKQGLLFKICYFLQTIETDCERHFVPVSFLACSVFVMRTVVERKERGGKYEERVKIDEFFPREKSHYFRASNPFFTWKAVRFPRFSLQHICCLCSSIRTLKSASHFSCFLLFGLVFFPSGRSWVGSLSRD